MSRSPLRYGLFLIPLVLTAFALLSTAQAQLPSPTPDGGYANDNTAEGTGALSNVISGSGTGTGNTALGVDALFHDTTGLDNTATGRDALLSNTTGFQNTATGAAALGSNTTGAGNTATGQLALGSNGKGSSNTATGLVALNSNTTGAGNTATGVAALQLNATGSDNTATGIEALKNNSTGNFNTAVGFNALLNTTGSSNVGLGTNAGKTLTTGSGNVCIGVNVFGVAGESNTTRIRNVYSSVASGRAVFVNSDNKIGTVASSRRYKEEIKGMDKASEAILALKPVTFRYKKEVDPAQGLSFGLIAEEVAQVNPELVTRDEEGKPETVRYEAVNAMLLNEFLKEHRKVEQQRKDFEAALAQQQKEIAALTATVKQQAAQIQKVSAQLEASKAAPQTVANN